jgi:hypothetical protein
MDIKETLRLHKLWVEGHPEGSRADLKSSNLKGANLYGTNLEGVDLKGVDLKGANLYGANLYGTNLEGAKLPNFLIAPEEGSFTAWKKTTKGVIKIIVPEDAERTNSLIGRKCRASKIVVVDGGGGLWWHWDTL